MCKSKCVLIYHLHVALQFADAGSLALGGAHVAQVMDGDGRTDAGVELSNCGSSDDNVRKTKETEQKNLIG